MTDLYFAYGSNLDFKGLADWCRKSGFPPPQDWLRPVWPAYLPDRALAFSRYSRERNGGELDVVPAVGCRVPGMIFEASGPGWEILDKREGVPDIYRRRETDVIGENNETYRVAVYEAVRKEAAYVKPTEEFLSIVRRGLADFDIDGIPFEEAVKNGGKRPGEIDGLFVYGTLMRGESRHACLSEYGPTRILLAETWGRLFDCGSYPGMILDLKTIPMVQGEFYRFPSVGDVLPRLDGIEGFAPEDREQSLFQRIIINVGMGDGRVRPAWTYTISRRPPEDAVIPAGDWREHRGTKGPVIREIVGRHCANIRDLDGLIGQLGAKPASKKDRPEEASEAKRDLILKAVLERRISERKLAQSSGLWAVDVGQG